MVQSYDFAFHVVYIYLVASLMYRVPSLFFTRWLPAPTTEFLFQRLINLPHSLNPLYLRTGSHFHELAGYVPVPAIKVLFQSLHGLPVAHHTPSFKNVPYFNGADSYIFVESS